MSSLSLCRMPGQTNLRRACQSSSTYSLCLSLESLTPTSRFLASIKMLLPAWSGMHMRHHRNWKSQFCCIHHSMSRFLIMVLWSFLRYTLPNESVDTSSFIIRILSLSSLLSIHPAQYRHPHHLLITRNPRSKHNESSDDCWALPK